MCTYSRSEDNMAVFLVSCFTLLLTGRFVIGDVSHMTLFLVAMVTFDGTIVHSFFDLNKKQKWLVSSHDENILRQQKNTKTHGVFGVKNTSPFPHFLLSKGSKFLSYNPLEVRVTSCF